MNESNEMTTATERLDAANRLYFEEFWTISEIAELLGLSRTRIHQLLGGAGARKLQDKRRVQVITKHLSNYPLATVDELAGIVRATAYWVTATLERLGYVVRKAGDWDRSESFRNHPIYHNYGCTKSGVVISWKSGRPKVLSCSVNGDGYPKFYCGDADATIYAHRFVWECWMGPIAPNETREINHIDADKTNPRLENLELVTPRENIRHAMELGLHPAAHVEVQ